MKENGTVLENIRVNYADMFSAEKKVADCILNDPEKATMMNVSELANMSGVSDATVIRMCKHIGYQGYYQLKIKLSNDLGRNQMMNITDGVNKPNSIKDIFQVLASNIILTANNLNMETVSTCIELMKKANTVHLIAAGNTSPITCDFGFRLGRFGIRSSYSMIPEYFMNHINLGNENDIILAISRSGSSKQVVQGLELAKEKKMKIIAITGHEFSPVSRLADYLLLIKEENPLFVDYKPESHIYEAAIIDVLLYAIANGDEFSTKVDDVEMLLSEYKL